MGAKTRPSPRTLKRTLLELPQRFEFFQAVRLLERSLPKRKPIGMDALPREEVVRFGSRVALSYPIGDVSRIELPDPPAFPDDPGPPARMQVDFMGAATGHMAGSLPVPYIVALLEEERERRHAFRDFLDTFNHRLVSLFYRAWKKSRLALMHETPGQSAYEPALFSLIGMGTGHLRDRLPVQDEALLSRAGLLMRTPAPALAIEALIASYFGVPARIEPFIPTWYPLEPEDRSRIGLGKATLGRDAVLGGEVLLLQSKFRVRIGPLRRDQYERLLPHGPSFAALWRCVRLAAGPDLDFDIQLVMAAAEVPRLRLETGAEQPGRLGGSIWLASKPLVKDAEDAILKPPQDLLRTNITDGLLAAG
jgi:type VI secretion system protein ImpH